MSILVAAAEAGSLSAAARRLGAPLATVSRKVSELEKRLQARLLNRSARRLSLTDAGSAYVAACKRILEEVDEAERAASGEYREPKGDLTVTAPIVFGRLHVLPVVTDFLEAYPAIDLKLTLADRVAHLLEDRIDVAIRIGRLSDSSLVATQVGAVRRVICASPAYFSRHGLPARPEDLERHDCVAFEGLSSPAVWTFARYKSEMTIPIRSRLIVTTAEAAVDAAIAGVGVARVFSYQAVDAVRAGALVLALEEFEPAPWPVSLVRATRGLTPLKLRAFLDFATPRLKERLVRAAIEDPAPSPRSRNAQS
jgi:DNA-binding transcriptional LysR family regulator